MASYLDQPYQFKPYVATQPVEAMVKVGMIKQQQYDEGVQKIRDLLDQQTMLPVSRQVDIDYLQGAVNSVTGELKKLGAADFSNQQLVQSVAGLTKKISKDPYILDAVASTEHRKSELVRRQELEKTGKTSISNDIVFNKDWSDYYNSTDMGKRFSSTYTPYSDVNKKAVDVIKGLHSNLQKIDDPYEIINGIKTGRLADVLKKYSVEGISEPQIMMALKAAFTPDDYNQLRIEGKAQFMNVPGEKLADNALKQYETTKLSSEKELAKLKEVLPAYKADVKKYTQMQSQIAWYEEQLGKDGQKGKLELDLVDNLKSIKDNPDEVKYRIYKDAFFNSFGNGFKWTHMAEEVADSPYYKVAADKRDFNYQRWRDSVADSHWDADYVIKVKTYEDQKRKTDFDMGLLPGGAEPNWQRSGNETTAQNEGVANFKSYIGDLSTQKDASYQRLIDAGQTPDQIEAMLALNAKNGQLPPAYAREIQNLAALRNKVDLLASYDIKTLDDAARQSGLKDAFKNLSAGKRGLVLTVKGKTFNLSAEDMLAISAATTTNIPAIAGSPETYKQATFGIDKTMLTPKQIQAVEMLQGIYYGVPQDQALRNLPGFHDSRARFGNEVAQLRTLRDETQKIYTNKLGKVSSQFVTRIAGSPTTKEGKVPPSTLGTLMSRVSALSDLDLAANSNYDRETTLKLLEDAENAKVLVENAGDHYNIIISSFAEPDAKPQVIRADRNFVTRTFGETYVNKYIDDALFLDIGEGNTDIMNDPTKSIYQKQFGYFPNVTKYNVKGSVQKEVGGPSVIPEVQLEDINGRFIPFQLAGENMKRVTGFESTMKGFGSMTDDQLEKLIRQSYPSFDFNTLKKYR